MTELDELRDIVEKLAESFPGDGYGCRYCRYCSVQERILDPREHNPDCLWRRAKLMQGRHDAY